VAGGCPASLRPGRWLDLYSGTGSVGIEALSRGCSESEEEVEVEGWVDVSGSLGGGRGVVEENEHNVSEVGVVKETLEMRE
ncbi:putative rRNA methyltransferase YlbH, partial [Bienertia sinuspersici]